jgi:hypothetical protein
LNSLIHFSPGTETASCQLEKNRLPNGVKRYQLGVWRFRQ